MSYTDQEKQAAIMRYQSGESIASISDETRIARSTLYNWIHQYSEIKLPNDTSITAKQVHLLEKRIKRLTAELEIWKRCGCTLDSPLTDKLKAIEVLSKEFGVHAPCRVLEVRRSTFYHHIFRSPEQTLIQKRG